ncbi:hypothetical protein [Mariniflexile sp. HMF6888]|uniref:hypothetical protein n=1 Tax=Mariniflexile sp. HMF6888 TaxID=3373086 RepID=UPI0037B310D8
MALYAFQEKSILSKHPRDSFVLSRFKYFSGKKSNTELGSEKHYLASALMPFGFSRMLDVLETKRLADLSFERIKLKNKLRMLGYILEFELYLSQNKIDKSRFSQMKELNDLKLSTQKSILKSTRRISSLSTKN